MADDRQSRVLLDAYAAGITSPMELANYMAQVTHESLDLKRLNEGFRYTQGIDQIPVRSAFRNGRKELEEARLEALQGKPEHLGELMYGGRMGNTDPGDGYKYHGRGYIQLTGKDQYAATGKTLGLDLVNHPELASEPDNASKIALAYWKANVHGTAREDVGLATRAINNGDNGLKDRQDRFAAWKEKLTPEVMAGLAKGKVDLTPPLSDKHHPGHTLYAEALAGLQKWNRDHHIESDQRTLNAAAALAVVAHRHGLKHVHHVEPSDSGEKLFAVQGKPGTAHSKVIDVPTVNAISTPVQESSKIYLEPVRQDETQQQNQMQNRPHSVMAH